METTIHNGFNQTAEMTEEGTHSAKDKVQSAIDQGERKVVNMVENARDQIKSTLANQKDQASTKLENVVGALKQTSNELREHGQGSAGKYTNTVAEQIEYVSVYLHDHDLAQIAQDTETLTRRRPALMLSAAFILGVMVARFIKSSRRYA